MDESGRTTIGISLPRNQTESEAVSFDAIGAPAAANSAGVTRYQPSSVSGTRQYDCAGTIQFHVGSESLSGSSFNPTRHGFACA